MTPRMLIHTTLLLAVIAALGVGAMDCAPAAEPHISGVSLVGTDATTIPVTLRIGKSLVYDFPSDIKDVLVADPKTANVVIRSSRRAYIIGDLIGETSIVFFDAGGMQMARFEITVTKVPVQRDVSIIEKAILNLLCPRRDVQCEDFVKVASIGDGIILTGTVASQLEAQQAFDIASHFLDPCAALGSSDSSGNGGPGSSSSSITGCAVSGASSGGGGGGVSAALNGASASKIVNAIVVRGRDQVMLKVTIAEMDRTVIKQLGINLNGSLSLGTSTVNFNNNNPFPVNGQLSTANPFGPNGLPSLIPNSPAGVTGTFNNRVTANLQAMEQAGVVRTLAEPTLTAISGESAHFLAGGSFPYPTVSGCTTTPCPLSIQFQPFGVGLNFTPVVLSEGRISLHVATEVSELSTQNSVTVQGTTVPGLTVRRADTTAEISSGGTLVIAGMIQQQTKQTISGLPGVMAMPVLGALFKSRDYLNNLTELVVMVTPYIAHAVAQKDVSRPDDGFADPSDPASVLLGTLNRVYGVNGRPPGFPYHGNIGFILD